MDKTDGWINFSPHCGGIIKCVLSLQEINFVIKKTLLPLVEEILD